MKKIFVMLLLCQWCKAQINYSNTYNVDNYGAVSVKVIEHNNKFNVMGFGRYLYKNWLPAQTSIVQININDGNDFQIKNIENYPDSSYNNPSFDFIKTNSGFLMATSCADTLNNGGDNRNDFLLTWLDNDLNVVRRKLWGFANKDDFADKIATLPNGDIIFLGRSNVIDTYGQCYLYRLDSLGNIIWQTTFGQIGKQEEGISMEVIGNSIYISGFYINRSIEYIRSFVYKYNTNGDFIATSIYPVEYYNGCSRIKQISSNKFVLSGSVGYNWTNYSDALQIYIDSSLNKINHTIINPIDTLRQSFFDATYYDAERGLILNAYSHYRTQFGGSPLSGVIATDTAGNIRWQQEYYTRTDAPQYLYDIQKTSDGGYIMCGSALSNETNPTYDFWVIKTDSVGCVVNCITGIDNISPPVEGLGVGIKLYPNPAHDFVNIEIPYQLLNDNKADIEPVEMPAPSTSSGSTSTMPVGEPLPNHNDQHITLYNTEGKAVPANIRWHHAANVSSSRQERIRGEVNIQHLPRGLYFVRIGNHSAKFVKE